MVSHWVKEETDSIFWQNIKQREIENKKINRTAHWINTMKVVFRQAVAFPPGFYRLQTKHVFQTVNLLVGQLASLLRNIFAHVEQFSGGEKEGAKLLLSAIKSENREKQNRWSRNLSNHIMLLNVWMTVALWGWMRPDRMSQEKTPNLPTTRLCKSSGGGKEICKAAQSDESDQVLLLYLQYGFILLFY